MIDYNKDRRGSETLYTNDLSGVDYLAHTKKELNIKTLIERRAIGDLIECLKNLQLGNYFNYLLTFSRSYNLINDT